MTFDEKFEKLKQVTKEYEQAVEEFEEKRDKQSMRKVFDAIDEVTKLRIEVCRWKN